jgi:hypothetical protein
VFESIYITDIFFFNSLLKLSEYSKLQIVRLGVIKPPYLKKKNLERNVVVLFIAYIAITKDSKNAENKL